MAVSYLLHGVRLASEIILADVHPHRTFDERRGGRSEARSLGDRPIAVGATDVRVELREYQPVGADLPPGSLILDHHLEGHRQYAAARTGDHVRFRVPGHGDFDLTDGLAQIACTPDPRVAPGYLPIMLTGNVLSFLLSLTGHTVLHAGAVEVAGGAVAIVGPSGVGKSTLTAWLCTAGARLITDDLLRLDNDGTCHRGGREIRLRPRARPLVDDLLRSGGAARRTVDGRYAVRPATTASTRLPVQAVVIPRPLPGARELAVHTMDAVSAAMMLASVPRTLGWRLAAPSQTQFITAADVAANVGVHVVDIPWGPPFDGDTPRRLLDLLGVEAPDDVAASAGSAVPEPVGQA